MPAANLITGVQHLKELSDEQLDVTIIGTHAGISTQPSLYDIAITRPFKLTIISPSGNFADAVTAGILNNGPTYIRLHDGKQTNTFDFKHAPIIKEGQDCTIIATSNTIHHATKAAELLANEDLACTIIDCSVLKPLDNETILGSAHVTGSLVTVEEHGPGGLHSMIAELTSQYTPVPVQPVMATKPELTLVDAIITAAKTAIIQRCQAACIDIPQLMGNTTELQTPHGFRLYSGTSIHSLPGLQHALLTMTDATFSHHCNDHKNDFSTWIADVFNEPQLAEQLRTKKTKLAMASTLAHWLT